MQFADNDFGGLIVKALEEIIVWKNTPPNDRYFREEHSTMKNLAKETGEIFHGKEEVEEDDDNSEEEEDEED